MQVYRAEGGQGRKSVSTHFSPCLSVFLCVSGSSYVRWGQSFSSRLGCVWPGRLGDWAWLVVCLAVSTNKRERETVKRINNEGDLNTIWNFYISFSWFSFCEETSYSFWSSLSRIWRHSEVTQSHASACSKSRCGSVSFFSFFWEKWENSKQKETEQACSITQYTLQSPRQKVNSERKRSAFGRCESGIQR